jgi:hypothetical protein
MRLPCIPASWPSREKLSSVIGVTSLRLAIFD